MAKMIHVVKFLAFVMLGAAPHIVVNAEADSDHATYPVRIVQVTKTEGPTDYAVRVEYEANTRPTVFLNVDGILTEVTQTHPQLGIVDVRVPKNKTGRWVYDALVFLYDHLGLIHVHINLTSPSNSMEVPRIHLQIQPGSDIILQPEGFFLFNLSYNADGDSSIAGLHQTVFVMSDDEENTVIRYTSRVTRRSEAAPEMLKFERGTAFRRNHLSGVFRAIPPGRRVAGGIFQFDVKTVFNCMSDCLVQSVVYPLHIRFYRADQTGPFPPGFIGFVRDAEATANSSQLYCGFHAGDDWPCYLGCQVAGDHPQAVQLSRVGSNCDDNQTEACDVFTLFRDYDATAYKLVHSAGSLNGDFLCTARSPTREITKTLSVSFVKYPKIDKELSAVTKFENGSISAICVATGRPAPNISFFRANSGPPQNVSPEDYNVTVIHVDEQMTRAELFMPEPNGIIYFVDCLASNNPDRTDWIAMNVDR